MTERRKAVLYLRVSTMRQADEGVSLEVQRDRLQAWCHAHDYEIVGRHTDDGEVVPFSDNRSGGSMQRRPGLHDALREVCKCRGILAVYSLTRLGRSTLDLLTISSRLKHAKADLFSLSESLDTSSPSGELFFTLMAAIATFERRQIADRVKAAMAHCRRSNALISHIVPYGYRAYEDPSGALNKRGRPRRLLREVPEEQATINRIMELYVVGIPANEIADTLNENGIKAPRAEKWVPAGVRCVVKRKRRLMGHLLRTGGERGSNP